MSESGLKKLRRLGFQFWSPKLKNKEVMNDKGKEIFFLLGQNILIVGNLKEFNKYVRFVPSITRVLGMTDLDTKEISKKEALEKDFHLTLEFVQNSSFKSKKTIKFDSLKLLMNDARLKKDLYDKIRDLT